MFIAVSKRIVRASASAGASARARGKRPAAVTRGQWSHNGVSFLSIFQGGTMPLVRRIPKRGFNNRFAKTVLIVNIGDLNAAFKSGDKVTPESLAVADLVHGKYDVLKILGNGEVTKKLKISAHRFS